MDENRRKGGQGRNSHQKYSAGRHKAKHGTTEWAKKRTRSIQRAMSRNADIPANLRNDMERELAAHKNTIADNGFQRRRSAMISKYHMVRFFERKKAERLVKQLKRKIDEATDDEERAKLQADLHIAEVDEAYTQHHPHAEIYISLYGNAKKDAEGDDDDDDEKKTPAAKAALAAERPPMWKIVEATMKEGPDALRQLRERRSADGETEAPAGKPRSRNIKPPPQRERMANVIAKQNYAKNAGKPDGESKTASAGGATAQQNGAKPGLNRRERRRIMRETMAEADKDDDEGGFFEM
ncbi:hypothetical protein NLG97_g1396 [Lecanicillium saksenae]|uniref:Uncharacterized protein n=1 Tax=Lecanicillium saksenae TaxID=468837 RepID=A0ACC1R4H6_9HYPO|nr:hypothetical protein NLG97_g1396 [Lecanicillium saksenae]